MNCEHIDEHRSAQLFAEHAIRDDAPAMPKQNGQKIEDERLDADDLATAGQRARPRIELAIGPAEPHMGSLAAWVSRHPTFVGNARLVVSRSEAGAGWTGISP